MFSGLSPRWRGNLTYFGHSQAGRWSIPALAGQPSPPYPLQWRTRVYPRAGGATPISGILSNNNYPACG